MNTTPYGPVQVRVLDRARRSRHGAVVPAGFLERRALRRLEARGVVRRSGSLDMWELMLLTGDAGGAVRCAHGSSECCADYKS